MKFLIRKTPDNFLKAVNNEISSILSKNLDGLFPEYGFPQDEKLSMPVELKEKKLKQSKCPGGYTVVNLWKDNSRKMFLVHRLVAEAFLENKNKLPEVNHKDENKENNRVDNLEWCDAAYNNCYGTRLERVVKSKINGKKSYPVIQKIDNKVIETFPSLREVQRRTGYNKSLISKCCKGIYKQAYGYNWEFVSK